MPVSMDSIGGLINAGFHGQYVCCRGERRGF